MKAFVTGITGFAGSHLTEHLLASGDEVLGCSSTGYWKTNAAARGAERMELLQWNLAEPAPPAVRDRVAAYNPDCIYHLAAISVPANCGDTQPTSEAVAVNVDGTRRVLELAANLPAKPRFLLTSSSHVYAPVSFDAPRVTEEWPLDPRGAYGKTKLVAEREVAQAGRDGAVAALIARSFNHSGPRQSDRMMLPHWARQLAQRDSPVQVVTLDSYVDLSDVRDVVRAYRILVANVPARMIYNVGSGICRRCGDVFERLQALCPPAGVVVELAPGRRQLPIADLSRIFHDTTWRPEIPLDQTLADTLAYWQTEAFR